MTWAIIIGLSGLALYLGTRLNRARAEVAELILVNARLKRRLARSSQ